MIFPKVSIITSLYNHELYVKDLIESVQLQSFEDFEHILVDDGSTDRSGIIVESFAAKDSRIKYYSLTENKGSYFARNQAILKSIGSYIALIDSDDMLTRDSVEIRVDFLDKHPDVDFVYARSYYIRGQGGVDQVQWLNETNTGPKMDALIRFNAPPESYWDAVNSQTVMIRRTALEKFGLFDETLRYKGDKELWFRFLHHGCKSAFIPIPIALRRIHDTNISNSKEKLGTPVEELFFRQCHKRLIEGITINNTMLLPPIR